MADQPQSPTTEDEPQRSASPRASTPPANTRPSKKAKSKTTEAAVKKPKKAKKRDTKLYDAVAGRGSFSGIEPVQTFFSPSIAGRSCMRPDEMLFRSRAAPDRLEEDDMYFKKRPDDINILPSSDLLKSIHAYVSFYVEGKLKEAENKDTPLFERLDGAALLAMGVLVEEMARDIVETENVVGRLVDEGDGEKGRDKSALDLMEEVKRWQGRKGRGRGDLETWTTGHVDEREEMNDADEDGDGETDDEPDAELDGDDLDLGI